MSVPPAPPTLAQQASSAAFWVGAARLASQVLQLGIAAILTRLLSPDDFGVVAMVLVFSSFLGVVSNAGVSSAIVQFRDLHRDDLATIFTLSLLTAFGVGLLLAALAFPIASFYGMPAIAPVVLAMSGVFVLSGPSRVPVGLLERDLAFRALARIRVAAALFAGLVAVVLAFSGAGYWALVAQLLGTELVSAALVFSAARWRPRLAFDRRIARRVFGYAGHLTLFNVINYWARNLDNLLIGRFLGSSALGFYNRAYALMLYPVNALSAIVTPVLHPVLSALQNDIPKMTRAFLRIASFIATLAFPAMTALALLAPEVVLTIWGSGWGRSVPVFRVLCVVGAVQSVVAASASIFLATGRTSLLLRVGTFNAVVVMIGISVGLRGGIQGVALGYCIAACLTSIPTLYLVSVHLLAARPLDVVRVLARPLTLSILVAVPLALLNAAVRGIWSAPAHLAAGAALSTIIYVAGLRWLGRGFLAEIHDMLPPRLRRRLRWLIGEPPARSPSEATGSSEATGPGAAGEE